MTQFCAGENPGTSAPAPASSEASANGWLEGKRVAGRGGSGAGGGTSAGGAFAFGQLAAWWDAQPAPEEPPRLAAERRSGGCERGDLLRRTVVRRAALARASVPRPESAPAASVGASAPVVGASAPVVGASAALVGAPRSYTAAPAAVGAAGPANSGVVASTSGHHDIGCASTARPVRTETSTSTLSCSKRAPGCRSAQNIHAGAARTGASPVHDSDTPGRLLASRMRSPTSGPASSTNAPAGSGRASEYTTIALVARLPIACSALVSACARDVEASAA